MSIEMMKAEVLKLYPNDTWKKKVEKMSQSQIMAIYFSKIERRQ